MSRLSPTRMSLLAERAKVVMAAGGVEILERKRDALLSELYRAAGEILEFRRAVTSLATEATVALAGAQAAEGERVLASLAGAARRELRVTIETRNVWGVRVPSVRHRGVARRARDRGHGLFLTSAAADDAADAHERLVAFVLENAPREIRLRRLADELRRTSRKVNTLQNEILPRLRRNVRTIAMALEEQEMQDRVRLQMLPYQDGRGSP